MTKFFLIASAALAAATSPALASDAKLSVAATTEASQPAASAPRASQAAKKYCVADALTGSRIAKKVCKTREAWLREGFDPLAQ